MATELIAQPISGTPTYRVRGELPDSMPIVLRSAVHAHISAGRFRQPWSKRLVLVKWLISGEAAIRVSGRRLPIRPGEMAVYMPTIPHEFWAVAPASEMCWFSVDGPLAEQFAYLLGLRPGVYSAPNPPVAQIDRLVEALHDQSLAARRHTSEQALSLLYQAVTCMPPQQPTTVVRQVQHLVREGLGDPDLSAKRIAAQLNYNRGSLSRTFHQHTGITIMDCITQTRLQLAETLLSQSDDRITDIAHRCGFRDVSYFTRWIKKHVGRVPHHLRGTNPDGRGPREKDEVRRTKQGKKDKSTK